MFSVFVNVFVILCKVKPFCYIVTNKYVKKLQLIVKKRGDSPSKIWRLRRNFWRLRSKIWRLHRKFWSLRNVMAFEMASENK